MRRLLNPTALALVAMLVALLAGGGRAQAVISGEPADPQAWPFVVALLDPAEADPFEAQFCAGTLVHPRYVLTAAHCVERDGRFAGPAEIQVAAGRNVLSQIAPGERLEVSRVIPYPARRAGGHDARPYDIAMLELAAPLAIPTAVLALNYGDQIGPGRLGPDAAWVAGWGETGAGFPDELLTGRATLSSANACRATLGLPFGTFCASPPAGANACFGDSGGPLASFEGVVELLGIVSFGRVDCAGPVAYTNVGLYKPWIASVFRGGDPAVGMPEVRNTRLRQTAAGVEIYANWCQLAALGHRQRISYTLLHGARGFSRIRTITFVGRASGPCMEARGTIPAHRLGPGLWRLLVKVEDTSARLGYAARDISYIRVR